MYILVNMICLCVLLARNLLQDRQLQAYQELVALMDERIREADSE